MSEGNGQTVDLDKLDPQPTVEYKLSWEMCEPQMADYYESRHGKDIWPRLTDKQWDKLRWMATERTSTDLVEIADQRATLELWATTKDQPVRNVQFFRRSFHLPSWDKVIDE